MAAYMQVRISLKMAGSLKEVWPPIHYSMLFSKYGKYFHRKSREFMRGYCTGGNMGEDTGKEGSRRVFAAAADLFGTMPVFTWSNEGKLQKTSVCIADPK